MNAKSDGRFKAYSAGSQPKGRVHPYALKILKQKGISVTKPTSQSWDDFKNTSFDFVVTVCSNAAKEICPIFPGPAKKLDWSMDDPDSSTGTSQEQIAFEKAYSYLEAKIDQFLTENS